MRFIIIISASIIYLQGCHNKEKKLSDFQYLTDSLSQENNFLKAKLNASEDSKTGIESLQANKSRSDSSLQVYTLVGSFVGASLYDCFHLSFKDTSGAIRDFDSPDNTYGMDIFDRSSSLRLKKEIPKKRFRIWCATLKGIDCRDADSYHPDSPKAYIDMPTIIKMQELR
ncbi:hypothetical protein MYP_4295 [Sporocytophaga myxococcoides]|uniref:Uncharacterized protein n=2 Tax=Sporocytophaga myxococcoides TaxID=153721 RepID=A0A098LJD3_9BACT|nr:hypothetical protein MYP_4295 [Sporocytophaga myxococcoides]